MNLLSSTQIYHNASKGAGSLGGFFTFGGQDIFALSNNHVIADVNDCDVGDPIYISGSKIIIGSVYCWVTLDNSNMNYLDIALAKLGANVTPLWRMPRGIIQPAGFKEAIDGNLVYMMNHDGSINMGSISNSNIDFQIDFNFSGIDYPFTDLIEIQSSNGNPFSIPGESGSIIFDTEHNIVGLLIGTNSDTSRSYAIPFINGDLGIKSMYDLDIWLPVS